MTDNTKMREAFERWARAECFDLAAVGGFYSDDETEMAWAGWQAAQSVPVEGEPVAWVSKRRLEMLTPDAMVNCYLYGRDADKKSDMTPLFLAPTNSIPATELERLRKDAERYRWLRSPSVGPATIWSVCMEHLEGGLQTLKSDSCLDAAIDEAIAGGGDA